MKMSKQARSARRAEEEMKRAAATRMPGEKEAALQDALAVIAAEQEREREERQL